MPWNPETYHRFQTERFAPFEDAMGLVRVRAGMSVVDLGCGTGELTRRLADALPLSDVVGVDSSPEMLSKTRALARPGLRFERGALETTGGEWDLVFSHAAIQWVDDHRTLVPRLFAMVRPGGRLVVQVPSNHLHPAHTLITEVASMEPFATDLGGWTRRSPVLGIDEYAELLFAQGGRDLEVFEKVYPHVLEDADDLADWTSGTALVPYFERMFEDLRERFMATYRERLRARWPVGPVFYPFRRTFFAATRPGG